MSLISSFYPTSFPPLFLALYNCDLTLSNLFLDVYEICFVLYLNPSSFWFQNLYDLSLLILFALSVGDTGIFFYVLTLVRVKLIMSKGSGVVMVVFQLCFY